MLEKDPNQRFDINEVDDEIKRIDLKTNDIFEGILKFHLIFQYLRCFIAEYIIAIEKDLIEDVKYFVRKSNLEEKNELGETSLIKGILDIQEID